MAVVFEHPQEGQAKVALITHNRKARIPISKFPSLNKVADDTSKISGETRMVSVENLEPLLKNPDHKMSDDDLAKLQNYMSNYFFCLDQLGLK
jgi:hypothetical protein